MEQKFEKFKAKLTSSNITCAVLLAAFIVIGAFLAYTQSQKTTGKFMAKHFYNIPMETYILEKFDTATDAVTETRELNKDQVTELSHYIHKADFKKVKEIAPTASEGIIFRGTDKDGSNIFYLKSYGNEFAEGYMIYPDGSRPDVEFTFKIISENWEETFNKYF